MFTIVNMMFKFFESKFYYLKKKKKNNKLEPHQEYCTYLPQSPKTGPAPAERASLPSLEKPYEMDPVPAIKTHP